MFAERASAPRPADELVMMLPEEGCPHPTPMTYEQAYDDMHADRIVGRAADAQGPLAY
ncbi:MAG: hypothetical protein Q7J48_21435 [Nocardioides sp.]|nr:hypothetical protein [Nocardioides sp.]